MVIPKSSAVLKSPVVGSREHLDRSFFMWHLTTTSPLSKLWPDSLDLKPFMQTSREGKRNIPDGCMTAAAFSRLSSALSPPVSRSWTIPPPTVSRAEVGRKSSDHARCNLSTSVFASRCLSASHPYTINPSELRLTRYQRRTL